MLDTLQPYILIVDDDREICQLLKDYLQKYGYNMVVAYNGDEMFKALKQYPIDLIILDIMLPGEDGFSLCQRIRTQSEVSIIMLSACADEADRVTGLEVGADDYLTKPFSPRELLARVKALLRRSTGELAKLREQQQLAHMPNVVFAGFTLDRKQQHLIDAQGVTIPLTKGEYELLLAFIEHPHRVLSRDQLLDLTRGRQADPFDRSIDMQVGRLRKKIEVDAKHPLLIMTVRGGGYQFTADVSLAQRESHA